MRREEKGRSAGPSALLFLFPKEDNEDGRVEEVVEGAGSEGEEEERPKVGLEAGVANAGSVRGVLRARFLACGVVRLGKDNGLRPLSSPAVGSVGVGGIEEPELALSPARSMTGTNGVAARLSLRGASGVFVRRSSSNARLERGGCERVACSVSGVEEGLVSIVGRKGVVESRAEESGKGEMSVSAGGVSDS